MKSLPLKKAKKLIVSHEIGINVIINEQHKGLLYKDEVYDAIRTGDPCVGTLKIRPDNKIDVSLQIQGYQSIEPNADIILMSYEQVVVF
jgi:predicted RNA-binding protein (virulence factor B family)